MSEESQDVPDKPMRSPLATGLMMRASRERTLLWAHEGIDKALSVPLQSQHVLLAGSNLLSEPFHLFLSKLGILPDELKAEASRLDLPEEEPGEPPRFRSNLDEENSRRDKRLMSKSVQSALRGARQRAQQIGATRYTAAQVLASAFSIEGNARQIVFSLAKHENVVVTAAGELAATEEPGGSPPMDFPAQTRELLDALWPRMQAEQKAKSTRIDQRSDELYNQDPERYETRFDLPKELASIPGEIKDQYLAFSGRCLHAFQNEARIRRAPEVTLDHVLYTLIQDGTDTSEFLDALGVDRSDWRARLDNSIPTYTEGPRWPINSRALGMSFPSNRYHVFKKDPPEAGGEKLSREEIAEYVERFTLPKAFTDIVWLKNVPDEERTLACALFLEVGIGKQQIQAAIRGKETGDPDWHLRQPSLAKIHRGYSPVAIELKHHIYTFLLEVAEFEARSRHDSEIGLDHILLAILRNGKETRAFLGANQIPVRSLAATLAGMLPTFSSGPLILPRNPRITVAYMLVGMFSDLALLEQLMEHVESYTWEPKPPGFLLLEKHGITLEAIRRHRLAAGDSPGS